MAYTYAVYYGTAATTNNGTNPTSTGWTLFAAAASTPSTTVTGLAASTTYYFRVIPTDTVSGQTGPAVTSPSIATPAVGESAQGTAIPPAASITDAGNVVWTLVGGVATRAGVATPSSSVILILYYNHLVYQENSVGGWWVWNNTTSAWDPSADPRPVPAGSIPILETRFTGNSLVDASNITWRLNLKSQVTYNNTVFAATSGVSKLCVVGSKVYHRNIAGAWFSIPVSSSPAAQTWVADTNPLPATQCSRALDFLYTMGANIHGDWPDKPTDADMVAMFQWTGIRLFRNYALGFAGQSTMSKALSDIGCKGNYIVPINFTNEGQAAYVSRINLQLAQTAVGTWFAIESVNEPGQQGLGSAATTKTIDTTLAAAVHSIAGINGVVPVANYSDWWQNETDVVAYQNAIGDEFANGIEIGNCHGYSNGGPYGIQGRSGVNGSDYWKDHVHTNVPNSALYMATEWGYCPNNSPPGFAYATELARAKMVLCRYCDDFYNEFMGSFYYQMWPTAGPDPAFAIYDHSSPPVASQAANALHNFTTILNDSGATARTFATRALNVTFPNLPAGVRIIPLQKLSTGQLGFIAWNVPEVQNSSVQDITPASQTVTVQAGATFPSVQRFDPIAGTGVAQNYNQVASAAQITFGVAGYPQILWFTP